MVTEDINLTPTATLFEIEPADYGSSLGAVRITGRTWGTISECQAACLLVHGLGGHSGWFEALARRLKVRKLFVLSYDLAGFGKRTSETFVSSKQWLSDLVTSYSYLKNLVGNKPIYLVGNSMGALLALKSCPTIKPTGLALLSPGFEGHPQTFPVSYRLKAVIEALLNPDRDQDLPYNPDLITSQIPVREWLKMDPDRRFTVPGRMLLDLLALTQRLRWQNIEIDCPALMLTASQDFLVNNRVNQKVFKRIKSPDKRVRSFPDSLHDLTLDVDVDAVADEITTWVEDTVPAGPAPIENQLR